MRARRTAGIATYFTVSSGNRSALGNSDRKIVIFPFRITAAFVKAGVYGFVAIQSDITLVFFVFKSQAIASPAAKSGTFLRNGFKVSRSASFTAFRLIFAILLETFTAIASAVYLTRFFTGILTDGYYTDHLADSFAGLSNGNRCGFFAAACFFVESGGYRFIATHYDGARTQLLRTSASFSPCGEFIFSAIC